MCCDIFRLAREIEDAISIDGSLWRYSLFLGFNGAAGKDVRNLSLRHRAKFTVGTVGQETGWRRGNNEYVVEQFALPFRST
jgi:hypothetical protein